MSDALLALEDGFHLHGQSFGATGTHVGEVCFNTAMTGYQEILTDPSYRGQLVALTYPHIGNYGINDEDGESEIPHAAGLIVRSLAHRPSNWRSNTSLDTFLSDKGIGGIANVDTRALVLHLREKGALRGVITTDAMSPDEAADRARAFDYAGRDFVTEVTTSSPYTWDEDGQLSKTFPDDSAITPAARPIAFIDYGTKKNILRSLRNRGFLIRVFPATAQAEEILASSPQAVFLSNGPGDPALLTHAQSVVRNLLGKIPIYGICLGHQILSLALGAKTYKLKFGHRGANHPVKDLTTGSVLITSQNHGYAVDHTTLPEGVKVTHINLNDNTCAGIRHDGYRVSAVQFHPEACPGPREASDFFDAFLKEIQAA